MPRGDSVKVAFRKLTRVFLTASRQVSQGRNALTQMGVPRISAILYETYILISRPRYDEKLGVWLPYASVAWNSDKYHYHQLTNLGKSFETQEERKLSASSMLAIGLTSISQTEPGEFAS
jgi:hypothetical protein